MMQKVAVIVDREDLPLMWQNHLHLHEIRQKETIYHQLSVYLPVEKNHISQDYIQNYNQFQKPYCPHFATDRFHSDILQIQMTHHSQSEYLYNELHIHI